MGVSAHGGAGLFARFPSCGVFQTRNKIVPPYIPMRFLAKIAKTTD